MIVSAGIAATARAGALTLGDVDGAFSGPGSSRGDVLDLNGDHIVWGAAALVPITEWEAMQPQRLRRPFPSQGDGTIKTNPKNRKARKGAAKRSE